ncbi:glutathione hydrolase 6, partial [Bufo bufo]|uniref:glutathione hydrolase 6 n=1 Tax=Bufo bufo TaxID=8384 RepID=UPI001ABEB72E
LTPPSPIDCKLLWSGLDIPVLCGYFSSSAESCSGVARDWLAGGGSVVDAGIAAVLCLAVVHPHAVSLGGTFASIYLTRRSQNASVVNAIPSQASPIAYGIPSLLQGLWSLHQNHGRSLWPELFSPAIYLAKQGFVVDSSLHAALEKNQKKIKSSESLQGLFYHQNILKRAGASVSNVQLGNVLEIAQTMRGSALPDLLVQQLLGDLEVTDREQLREALSGMHLKSENPFQLHLDGMTLYSSSAPTMGRILASSVQEMSQKLRNPYSAPISDLLINVSKTMYSMAGVKPSDFTTDRSAGAQIQWDLAPVGSNVLVADSDGNVLVVSLTLNSTFGSGFVSPSTGILLSDFVQGAASTPSATFSFWACPTVVLFGSDNDAMGLAARGGSSLPFSLAHVLLRHVLLKMDLTESINGTLTDLLPADSDPWLKYFGLQGVVPAMAIEVASEHVHVATSQSCSCHPAGL